jgi:hypothetical protein
MTINPDKNLVYSNVNPVGVQPYRIWPLRHNWANSLRMSLEFKTDMLVSGNGKEQRRAVRANPRQSFEMNCNYSGNEKFYMDRFFDQSPAKLAIFPVPHKSVKGVDGMEPETYTMKYRGGIRDWMHIGMMVLITEKGAAETRYVSGFSSTQMTFTQMSITQFTKDAVISLASAGRIDPDPQSTRLTAAAGTISIVATTNPGWDTYVPGTQDQYFVGFREYLNYKTDWGQSPAVTHTWTRDDLDYGYGAIETYVPFAYPSRGTKVNFWRKGYDESMSMIDFFCRMRGQNREFLFPSYERQIPYYAAASLQKSILIHGLDFAYTYQDTTVYKRILIRKKDGTEIHAQVDFIQALPDTNTSVIWLTEELPDTPLAPNDVFGIWWVTVARFGTDRLDIDWLTDEVAQFAFSVQNLENFDI